MRAAWFSDGKTILCGLVGGYFGVEVAKWSLQIQTKTGDSLPCPLRWRSASVAGVVSVPVAVTARQRRFPGQWCFPKSISCRGIRRSRTQSAFHLSCAIALAWCYRRRYFPGQLIKLYIIAYAVYRFGSEFIRPEARQWYGLTGYQLASAVLVVLFSWLWWRDSRQLQGVKFDRCELETDVPASD